MIEFTSKLPHVGTTIFTTMSALAAETAAVNLGQGFPDFRVRSAAVEMMNRASGRRSQPYPQMTGVLNCANKSLQRCKSVMGAPTVVANEITVTGPAPRQAIQTALTAIVHPGDEVIVRNPCTTAMSQSFTRMAARHAPRNL